MENQQANTSDNKTQKELKRFLIAGWIIAVVGLAAFGWAAVASLAFGGRCMVLAWHKDSAGKTSSNQIKLFSVALVILSAIELFVMYVGKSA